MGRSIGTGPSNIAKRDFRKGMCAQTPRGARKEVNKAERTMYGHGFQPLNLQSFALSEPAALAGLWSRPAVWLSAIFTCLSDDLNFLREGKWEGVGDNFWLT